MVERLDYDGLSLTEAIGLCTKRHEDLTSSDLKFIGKVGAAETLKPTEVLRLAGLVRKLRQGDLIAEISARGASGAAGS